MKKLLAILLAAMMVFALAACGENNTTDPDKDNPGVSQSGENNDDQGGENNDDKGGTEYPIADNGGEDTSVGQWQDTAYSAYTNGVEEPTFTYTIKSVIMDQLTINAEATVDEVNAWKQSLLNAGFEEYREGEQWGVSNATHNIQMNGFVNGVAYIYIGLQG
ncbi:MAG: hypothetical protein IJP35_04890 [Clostridia bacterium]|nr:hypothetical protein [Clostridia bacterium]